MIQFTLIDAQEKLKTLVDVYYKFHPVLSNIWPKIAMVTPSFNSEKTITKAIESILNQNYPNLDYVVMDGGSQDKTVEIAKRYEPCLRIISEKDKGQSHAINKGFRVVQGEIAGWLNADDWLLPGSLEFIAQAFQQRPHVVAIYGDGCIEDRNENLLRMSGVQPYELWRLIHSRNFIEQQSCFFRKDIFDAIGGVDENLHYVMDWDLWIRLGLKGDLEYIPHTLSTRLEVPENKTQSGHFKRLKEIYTMCHKYGATWRSPVFLNYAVESFATFCNYSPKGLLNFFSRVCRKLTRPFLGKTISKQFKEKCFRSFLKGAMPPCADLVVSAPKLNDQLLLEIFSISQTPYDITIRVGNQNFKLKCQNKSCYYVLIQGIHEGRPTTISFNSEVFEYRKVDSELPEQKIAFDLRKCWVSSEWRP